MQSVSKFEIMFDVQGSFHKTAKEEENFLQIHSKKKEMDFKFVLFFRSKVNSLFVTLIVFLLEGVAKNMAKKIYHYKFFLNIWSSKNVLEMNFLL